MGLELLYRFHRRGTAAVLSSNGRVRNEVNMEPRKISSRRDFLKLATLGATGSILLAACGQATPTPTAAPKAETPKPTEAPKPTEVAEAPKAAEAPKPTEAPKPAAAPAAAGATLSKELMPGSPDKPKGWATTLPQVPKGMPIKPMITITSSRRVDSSMKFAQGDTIDNSPFTRMSKELFGIEWKPAWTWATQEDGQQKYNLAMASGQLPDFLETIPATLYTKMLQANLLEDITDVWEKEADETWLKKPMSWGGGIGWSIAEVKGRKMGIPYVERAGQNDKVLWYRQDWLEKAKLQPPKTFDELVAVAKAFSKGNFGQGAANTTIGLNAGKRLCDWYSSLDPIFGGFGVIPNSWTKGGDGLIYDNVRPQMKDALALLNKWYTDGVIPKDFFTRDTADTQKLVAANQCGLHFSPDFGASFGGLESIKNDPTAKWNFADVPVGPIGKKAKSWSNPFPPSTVSAFRKGFKNVDAVIKMTAFMAELVEDPTKRYHGWEGRDYEWKGDEITTTDVGSSKQFYGVVGTNGNPGADPLRYYKQVQAIEEWTKIPREKRDAYQLYATEDPTGLQGLGRRAYLANVENTEADGIKNLFTTLPTPTMVQMEATLMKLNDESLISIISGEKPLSFFDEYVAQWKKLGGDKITKEVNDWWATAKK